MYSGRRKEGIESLRASLRLSPRDPGRPNRLLMLAISHYFEGEYEVAAVALKQVIRQYPGHIVSYKWLIASLGQLDKKAEAEAVMAISPLGFERYARQRPPFMRAADHEHMLEGMRRAGWQE